jgi:hypothetical protein
MFWMYVSQLNSSDHSLCGSEFACNMQDAISFKDLFSARLLHFAVECRELYVAIESLTHGKYYEFMIHILSPIISSEDFDLLSRLCLNQSFEIFEVLKDLRFLPEKVDPSKTSEIINKNENKPHFFYRWMQKRTHEVTVDEI